MLLFGVISQIRVLLVLVGFEVKRILRVQGKLDEAPVVIKSLLLDVLVLLSDNLVPDIYVVGSLLQSQ